MVTTGEVYRHFAQDVPLLDLSQHLPADIYDRLAPYIDTVPDPAGERGSVPGAIELSQSRFLQDAGLPEGSYYLFVPYNAPHVQALCQFIQYCFPAQPPR